MSEFDPFPPTSEGRNNFDNDFEKVEPSSEQDDVVSSTHKEEDDIYNPSPSGTPEIEPLVDLSWKLTPGSAECENPMPEEQPSAPSVTSEHEEKEHKHSECWVKNVDPRVLDLVLWRDPKKSGAVFGSTLVLLLSLACCSVLSVVAYLCLAALTVSISFVVYKKVMGAVQKSNEGHPFKQFLDMEIDMPKDKVHQIADHVSDKAVAYVNTLRHLFLVEDIVDSLKFGLVCWVLTYVGSWFNGMTLVILAVVALFTLPKVYEVYQEPIDKYMDLFQSRVRKVMTQIKSKIPLGKKKEE